MMTISVQSKQLEDRSMSDVQAQSRDKSTMKAIPKFIAIPAIAQCSVICRTNATSEERFETLIHEWLTRTTRLLQQEGFEGQELTAAVNGMMYDALTLSDQKHLGKV
jgi:hypothetical protein